MNLREKAHKGKLAKKFLDDLEPYIEKVREKLTQELLGVDYHEIDKLVNIKRKLLVLEDVVTAISHEIDEGKFAEHKLKED